MNSKMTTNSQLSMTEPEKQKQKLRKQLEQNRTREMEITRMIFSGEEERNGGGKDAQGTRSIIERHKIDRGRSRTL